MANDTAIAPVVSRTGTIKFDSIPQRFNIAITLALIFTIADAVQKLSEQLSLVDHIVERCVLLGLMACWAVKVFVDDHHLLADGKGHPAADMVFMLLSQGCLIVGASLIATLNVSFWMVGWHFAALAVWVAVSMLPAFKAARETLPGSKHTLMFWLVLDVIVSAVILLTMYKIADPYRIWLSLLVFAAAIMFDLGKSKTFKRDKLIGRAKPVEEEPVKKEACRCLPVEEKPTKDVV